MGSKAEARVKGEERVADTAKSHDQVNARMPTASQKRYILMRDLMEWEERERDDITYMLGEAVLAKGRGVLS